MIIRKKIEQLNWLQTQVTFSKFLKWTTVLKKNTNPLSILYLRLNFWNWLKYDTISKHIEGIPTILYLIQLVNRYSFQQKCSSLNISTTEIFLLADPKIEIDLFYPTWCYGWNNRSRIGEWHNVLACRGCQVSVYKHGTKQYHIFY